MTRQDAIANAYLAWFVAASVLMAIALALAFEDRSLWLWIPFLIAYISLLRGASCWFRHRACELRMPKK